MNNDLQILAFEDHVCRHFQNIQRQLTRIEMRLLRSQQNGITEQQVSEAANSLRGVRKNLQGDVAKSKKS